jgi:hypothetical protein
LQNEYSPRTPRIQRNHTRVSSADNWQYAEVTERIQWRSPSDLAPNPRHLHCICDKSHARSLSLAVEHGGRQDTMAESIQAPGSDPDAVSHWSGERESEHHQGNREADPGTDG